MEVWLLIIVGHMGVTTSLHDARQEAVQALTEYVQNSWEDILDEDMPEDPDAAVDLFFELLDEVEWYELKGIEIEAPDPPLAKDEVDLTEEEVAVTKLALKFTDHYAVAEESGKSRNHVRALMDLVYDKLSD